MTVLFPDIEPIVVSFFSSAISASTETVLDGVRVGTKKLSEEYEVASEVVITANYGSTVNKVLRNATVTVDVYSDSYSKASNIATLLTAFSPNIVGEQIKFAEVSVGPIRVAESSTKERRAFTLDLAVKGVDYEDPANP